MSNKELIPAIFQEGLDYWCAQGYGKYEDGKVTITPGKSDYGSTRVSIRCVYDEWYWGSERALTEDAKDIFTWGDAPRAN